MATYELIALDETVENTTGRLLAPTASDTGKLVGSLLVKDITISTGSITASGGAIDFGNENLSTTGTLSAGVITASSGTSFGTLTLADGSITDSGGSIDFGNENLSTTGTISGATGSTLGTLTLADGSITDSGGSIDFDNENLSTTGTLGAGALTVTSVTNSGAVTESGVISPSQITADVDDYAPTGIGTCSVIRVDADANGWIISGLSASQTEGRTITIQNDGQFTIKLGDEDTGSTAANRFALPDNTNLTIAKESSVTVFYDGTASRWRVKGGSGSGGGSGNPTQGIHFARVYR